MYFHIHLQLCLKNIYNVTVKMINILYNEAYIYI